MSDDNLQQSTNKSPDERFSNWHFEDMSYQMTGKVRMMQQIFASMEHAEDEVILDHEGIHGLEYFFKDIAAFIDELKDCAFYWRQKAK